MIKSNQPIKILMVEPEQVDREHYRRMLEQSERRTYVVMEVSSLDEASVYCAGNTPDCLLMGHHLGVSDCLQWLSRWGGEAGRGALPAVVLSAAAGGDAAEEADRTGRLAHLPLAHMSADALCHSIQRAVERLELYAQVEKFRAGALYDELTHLLSRNAIMEQLSKDLARAQRTGKVLGLGLCEIDDFERLEETYGVEMGQKMVAELARYIRGAIRATDSSGRYSDHQFLLILPGFDYSCATFERIRRATMGALFNAGEEKVSIGTSVAAIFCRGNESAEVVLEQADEALKEARAQGRSGVILAAHPGMQ